MCPGSVGRDHLPLAWRSSKSQTAVGFPYRVHTSQDGKCTSVSSLSLEVSIRPASLFLCAAFLQELVDRDNSKFEEWCVEMAEMRKQSVDKGRAKHEEVKELYQRLPAGAGL